MGGCSDAGFWSGREQTAKRSLGSSGSGLLGKERETHMENHIYDPITRSRPQAGLGLEYSFKNWSKPESLSFHRKSTCKYANRYMQGCSLQNR